MPSPGTQPSMGTSSVYGITPLSPSAPAYQSGPSSTGVSNKEQTFPQRPEQPECQYFMRTGDCKFGTSCRFHHPMEAASPEASTLSHIGLPLRPVSHIYAINHEILMIKSRVLVMTYEKLKWKTLFLDVILKLCFAGRSAMHSLCATRYLQVWACLQIWPLLGLFFTKLQPIPFFTHGHARRTLPLLARHISSIILIWPMHWAYLFQLYWTYNNNNWWLRNCGCWSLFYDQWCEPSRACWDQ